MKRIFLILSIVLTSCKYPVPLEHVYMIDSKHGMCATYRIVDKPSMKVEWSEDRPLLACDGYVSISIDEYPGLKQWIIEEQARRQRPQPDHQSQ